MVKQRIWFKNNANSVDGSIFYTPYLGLWQKSIETKIQAVIRKHQTEKKLILQQTRTAADDNFSNRWRGNQKLHLHVKCYNTHCVTSWHATCIKGRFRGPDKVYQINLNQLFLYLFLHQILCLTICTNYLIEAILTSGQTEDLV